VPLVFDAFYSLYDTVVMDRKLVPERSVRARIVLALDRISCRLADLVLVDTGAAARFFAGLLGVPEGKIVVVPPGVPKAFLDPTMRPKRVFPPDTVECLFYGSYVPLQGADTIIRAARILQDRTDVRLVMIGDGQDRQRVQRIADSEGLCNVEFLPWMDPRSLAAHVKGADVCLGIFGTSQKALRVVPYKVYGYMSLGKALITMDSEAAREVLVDESSALLVPPGDPEALAQAVSALACDAGLREQLARNAKAAFERSCTVETIAEDLRDPIAKTIEEHGG
jgi:glycosyltransferase involved in cell wall biosynthesis